MAEERRARRIYISGEVQGVGYRYFAHLAAEHAGVSGYVKNLADGRVEVYAIGLPAQLESFVSELQRGPRHARVADVVLEEAALLADFASYFSIESSD